MKLPVVFALVTLVVATGPASAAGLSEQGERALWCNMALELMIESAGFADADVDGASAASEEHAVAVIEEMASAGMTPREFETLSNSRWAEVKPAIETYLTSKDESALRFTMSDCLSVE